MKSRIGLFILIGLFLYIVDYRFSYDEDLNKIIIPDDEILGLIDTWRDQVGRDPSCLLYTSPSPRDRTRSRMPSSA